MKTKLSGCLIPCALSVCFTAIAYKEWWKNTLRPLYSLALSIFTAPLLLLKSKPPSVCLSLSRVMLVPKLLLIQLRACSVHQSQQQQINSEHLNTPPERQLIKITTFFTEFILYGCWIAVSWETKDLIRVPSHAGGKSINQIIGLCFAKLSWQQQTEHGGWSVECWESELCFFPPPCYNYCCWREWWCKQGSKGGGGRWTDTALLRCAVLKTTEHTGTDVYIWACPWNLISKENAYIPEWAKADLIHKARYLLFKSCLCTCQGSPVMWHSLHFESL